MSQNQIVNGQFQNLEGTRLANGYLIMQLSHDGVTGTGVQICANLRRKIQLDANGNVSGTVNIWPNDQLTPAGSFYWITVYAADGTQVSSRDTITITSSPSPFDLGADWIP